MTLCSFSETDEQQITFFLSVIWGSGLQDVYWNVGFRIERIKIHLVLGKKYMFKCMRWAGTICDSNFWRGIGSSFWSIMRRDWWWRERRVSCESVRVGFRRYDGKYHVSQRLFDNTCFCSPKQHCGMDFFFNYNIYYIICY